MKTKMQPIDDGRLERGHIATCGGCGCRGVFCDTHNGGVMVDCREVRVDTGDLPVLLVGKTDGTCADEVFCEDCADV